MIHIVSHRYVWNIPTKKLNIEDNTFEEYIYHENSDETILDINNNVKEEHELDRSDGSMSLLILFNLME